MDKPYFLLSSSDKFNKSFPPPAEVRIAKEDFRVLVDQNKELLINFDEAYEKHLDIRALSCTKNLSIGRFYSQRKVQNLPIDRDCLKFQDEQLLTYIGIKKVGARLAQPSLRPLKPLGTSSQIPLDIPVHSGHAAARAGVVILEGNNKNYISTEIPGGQKIADLPIMFDGVSKVMVSPNGRITAFKISNSRIIFIDNETGAKLWESTDIKDLYAWMPEISAALVNNSKNENVSIVDFNLGQIVPNEVKLHRQTWGLPVGISPSHVLVGAHSEFSLIEHIRSNSGIKSKIIKSYKLEKGRGVTSNPPTLMRDGKSIVFISSRDIMSVDLDSREERLWSAPDFLGNSYAKINESHLLVDSAAINESFTKHWVLDINKSTLAPINDNKGHTGILIELAGRTGYMRRGNSIWFGDSAEVGDALPLDEIYGKFNLERQIAKIESQEKLERMAIDAFNNLPPEIYKNRPEILRPSFMRRDEYSTTPVYAPLSKLPTDANIEAIGVYQGSDGVTSTAVKSRRIGKVTVRVRRTSKPLILILSSYESVHWNIVSDSESKLAAVLISGYHPSEVIGAKGAKIITIGDKYAYSLESNQYHSLNKEAVKWTGKEIGLFQGKYEGNLFSVGN